MGKKQTNWRWEEGLVDEHQEHIWLHYGKVNAIQTEKWKPAARIAKPIDHVFTVEWLISPDNPENQAIIADICKEIDFFLIELDKPDPWDYAIYHCSTASNLYSPVHWSYLPKGIQK